MSGLIGGSEAAFRLGQRGKKLLLGGKSLRRFDVTWREDFNGAMQPARGFDDGPNRGRVVLQLLP